MRARALKSKTIAEVVDCYNWNELLTLEAIRFIRVEFYHSDMVEHFCQLGNPVDVLRSLATKLTNGFASKGKTVTVEFTRVS